jgi:hypothetical protein
MTPKQIERIQNKIKNIRKTLYNEKRMFGCYDDSRGLRYAPLNLYLKIGDYKGGLTYLRWFNKNFPYDIGMPDFLFEWTIILFKLKKFKEAESKAIETYFANSYLFDKFFERPIFPIEKYENSNLEIPEFAEYLNYSKNQIELNDFAEWLADFEKLEKFKEIKSKFHEIGKKLKNENDTETRRYLLKQLYQLRDRK